MNKIAIKESIKNIKFKEEYILPIGNIESGIRKIFNDYHQQKALNNMNLRNWLREEDFSLGQIKGWFQLQDSKNELHQDLCVGFVAYLFCIENEFLSFDEWNEIDPIKLDKESRLYRLISMLQKCSIYDLEKSENFFIHEWEENQWFMDWSGINVDWSDWIGGPKIK
jgi:hypothetical protein